ncbi:MAG: hypothetical protein ACJAZX_001143 [Rickettsiales bacterium]|jgi:hypothetical protein
MTNTEDKKPAAPFKKPASPFSADPHNNRGGKGGNKFNQKSLSGGGSNKSSVSIKKFKGGTGGDK